MNRPRETGFGGGVATYIKHGINWKRRLDLENKFLECLCLEVLPKNAKSFVIIVMYRPPDSSKHLHEDFNQHFCQLLSMLNSETIVLGDMNVNYLNKDNNKEIKSIFQVYGYVQLVKEATRIDGDTKSLIDIIATNCPMTIQKTTVIPSCLSDHDMIGFVRKVNNIKYEPRTIQCRDYRNYDSNKLNEHLENQNWSKLYEYNNVNDAWLYMKNILQTVYNDFCPFITKKVKGKLSPWLTDDIKKLMNERDKLLRKYRSTNNRPLKDQLKEQFKLKRNLVNSAIKTAKSNHTKSLLQESAGNPTSFWKTLKRIFPSKQKSCHVENSFIIDGNKETNPNRVVNGFCEFYSTVVNSMKKSTYLFVDFVWKKPSTFHARTFTTFRFHYVSTVEIRTILKRMSRNKAAGPDNLPPNLIKDSANVIVKHLAYIINLSLRTGMFPDDWKIARVVPVHKSGPSDRFENFRPISALPIMSKIIEKIVHKRLADHLEENRLLADQQFGFRRKRSTELAATLFTDDIRKLVDSKNLVGCVFIDFSKAFDTLSHSKLLSKLPAYGITGIEYEWFTSYLFNRQQLVKYNNHTYHQYPLKCGVPQGLIIGPLLFLLYANDIVDHITLL